MLKNSRIQIRSELIQSLKSILNLIFLVVFIREAAKKGLFLVARPMYNTVLKYIDLNFERKRMVNVIR